MCKSFVKALFLVFTAIISCDGQSEFMLPFGPDTLRQIIRTKTPLPSGRKATLSDVRLHYYGGNSTEDVKTYRLNTIQDVLQESSFDSEKPTVFYAHGFVELAEDESVRTVVGAYLRAGGHNVVVVDWANLGFGSYLQAGRNVQLVGRDLGRRLLKLTTLGLPAARLHLVGHSLGAHLVAYAARQMKTKDVVVPRITGLDPAMPGFYPPLSFLGDHVTADDAAFVDIIHTDGGRYGASTKTGHADFWPNGGTARQPGCQINTVLFTYEDFCGHWRSWRFWVESLGGPGFDSRPCTDYEAFTRGECKTAPVAYMGEKADKDLRGNFYLRTAGTKPFSLGARGAE
ncbi:pancreatic triacylglycerol lipase [Plutella xylostella]|uniref:pancreatic triacylglycerol lipase n=1 Tax=Plutella xylostella TaxID=51655 RepID=UPI002032936E|nr:pancreatic triacylglycerol lipase [Plutella xylostella]